MEKPGLAVAGVIMVILVITASMLTTFMQLKIREIEAFQKEAQAALPKPVYGKDGKPGCGELETVPIAITENHVYFKDRVLECFYYNADNVRQCSEILIEVFASLPENVNKYLMIVPTN